MSSSISSTKIDTLEEESEVLKKINKAECVEGDPENGVMALLKYLIFVLKGDRGEKFIIERPEKFGGNKEYSSYEEVEKDFVDKILHPMDLKNSVAREINLLLAHIRQDKKIFKLYDEAYG
jgi:tyrosyl-tRNA synthetase